MSEREIKVLLADDTLIAREGWKRILETEDRIIVVGEVETAVETLRKVIETSPDVVLMDLHWMGDEDAGWTAIREIKLALPDVKVIAVTAYEHLIKNARRAGADAALTKTFTREQLLSVIEEVVNRLDPLPIPGGLDEDLQYEKLTSRQMDVLELLAKGKADKEIAEMLGIAESTAKNHVKSILAKLDVKNRTEAANKARKLGIIF